MGWPLSDADTATYTALGQKLGLTEFDPTTVDWANPVAWRNSDLDCDDGGAIMCQWAGYLIVCGFGLAFSLGTYLLTLLERKFSPDVKLQTSEHFNTAGREVKTGLTASVIVSQWTWAATLLQSSNVAWQYGVSGPFWYAAGASIQVLLFGVLAIEIKKKAPNAHTFLEMIDVRWGKSAHLTFLFFGICTNLIVTSMLLLGGSSVMNAVSGMSTEWCNFLIPAGVLFYTYTGGLKATFLASYIHTTIIFIGLVIFVSWVYFSGAGDCDGTSSCNALGSAPVVYERLKFITALPANSTNGGHHGPVPDNRGGSYLTMLSMDGMMFGIINVVGNFGTVFVDQSYWQSAIAADPSSAHKGYMLGGLCWFAIPFSLATSLGLAANALNVKLDIDEAGSGLVPPAAAIVLMGNGGGVLVIIMLFRAITSTGSAEAIAVSSLFSYDVYRKYFNPQASGEEILKMSKMGVLAYCCLQGFLAWILYAMELNLGWVYNFMGIVIGSAVPPVSMLLLWDLCTSEAAIYAAFSGQISAVITWLVVASVQEIKGDDGTMSKPGVNVDTTGVIYAQLAGNVVAIGMSAFTAVMITMIQYKQGKAQPFDWNKMNEGIALVESVGESGIKERTYSDEELTTARAWIFKYGVIGSIFLILIWPLSTMSWGVFSKSIYSLWSSVAVMWGYAAAVTIICLPIYENRATVLNVITWSVPKPSETTGKPTTEMVSSTESRN
jgi:SSS family transporter